MTRILLHPLPVRIWHWLNVLAVLVLLLTGFRFRVPGLASLSPRDPSFTLHTVAGIAMAALWIFWLVHGLRGGFLSRHYAIRKHDLAGIAGQTTYYLKSIFQGEKNPFESTAEAKFNPLQKLAYGAMMGLFTPVMIVTGLLLHASPGLYDHGLSAGAIRVAGFLHVAGLYAFALFLVIHVYMATLGDTTLTHIRGMIMGYEERPDTPPTGEGKPESGPAGEGEAARTGERENG